MGCFWDLLFSFLRLNHTSIWCGTYFLTIETKPSHGVTLPSPHVLWLFSTLYSGGTNYPGLRELWRWFHLLLWDGSPRASGIFLSLCSHHPSANSVGWPPANFGDPIPQLSMVLGPAISDSFSPGSPLHPLSPWQSLGSICVPSPTVTTQNPFLGRQQGKHRASTLWFCSLRELSCLKTIVHIHKV